MWKIIRNEYVDVGCLKRLWSRYNKPLLATLIKQARRRPGRDPANEEIWSRPKGHYMSDIRPDLSSGEPIAFLRQNPHHGTTCGTDLRQCRAIYCHLQSGQRKMRPGLR